MGSSIAIVSLVLVSAVGSIAAILTDPGPLCPEQTAVLTCNITGGIQMTWTYNSESIGGGVVRPSGLPPNNPDVVGGVEFTLTLLMPTSPHLVSQLNFTASASVDGGVVRCSGVIPGSQFPTEDVTLQVENNAAPDEVSVANTVPGGESFTVTIEWTPPTSGVPYTITTTPDPISPTMPVTITPDNTDPVQTDITVNYNTDYTVTVTIQTCDGPREASTTVHIVNCFRPMLSRGVMLIADPSTLEMILANTSTLAGDEIMYNCSEGFQPRTVNTSVCGDNGLWDPDPRLHTCTVDCGPPLFPSNGTGTVSETTVGAVATFQCEEGLLPSGLMTSTCTDTGQTGGGQWDPDPADIQCKNSSDISSETTPTTTTTTTTTTQSGGGGAAAAIGGAVGGIVAVIVLIIVIVVIVCVRKHKDNPSKKNITRHGGLELQEQPIMEYNTIGSRGYQPDSTTDEYSTVQHNCTPQHQPALESEYSLVGDSKNTVKGVGLAEGYSVLKTAAPPPPPETGMMYAALNLTPANVPPPVDVSTYKVIDHKATAKLEREKGPDPDASLDSNMMVIQIREAVSHWREYGKALGLPQETIHEIEQVKLEDLASMVEVAEAWLQLLREKKFKPTWKAVAVALEQIGFKKLGKSIRMVYTTGQLPITEKAINEVPADACGDNEAPPPLPPKLEDSDDASISLPPKPQPRVGSLKQPPPRPPKVVFQPSAPPRPPKSSPAQPPAPVRPPKPRHE